MSFTRIFKRTFTEPYALLPLAVFAYVVLCFVLHPLSPLRTGVLADPDDYMRLNEVINWLQGQGWHDLSQPRLSPGAHTIVHWSRLVDLPIALFMLPFIGALGFMKAALIASFIVPLFLLGLLLTLVSVLAKVFVGEKRANLAALLILFAPLTLFNFTPGRVDHHGYQVLIAGFALFCLDPILNDRRGWRFAILAAMAFAYGMWIGTEIMPWLILFTACAAFMAAWQGGFALRNAAVFGISLTFSAAAVLPMALPVEEFSSRALSWFSLADVFFAFLIGDILLIGYLSEKLTSNKILRLGVVGAFGLSAAAIFIHFVPDVLNGPYADYDNFNSTIALANITEAQPLVNRLHVKFDNPLTYAPVFLSFARYIFLPLAALGFLAYKVRRGPQRMRMIWVAHGVFLSAALLLAVFWQVRAGWFMELFMIAPLTGLLCAWWDRIRAALKGRPRWLAAAGAFLVLGALPVVLLPAIYNDGKFASDVLLFPAARTESACHLKPAAEFLADRWGYGKHLHTILAGSGEGPELLFRTPHNVIAANFDVAGNGDVYHFFNAHNDAKALNILRKWHADAVLVCRTVSPFYAGRDHPRIGENVFLRPGKDGLLQLEGSKDHPTLADRLIDGLPSPERSSGFAQAGAPPRWLKPVELPGNSDYLLFEITGKQ